jgi:hypothetical protein
MINTSGNVNISKAADIYENAEYNENVFSIFYTTKINRAVSHTATR